MCMGPSVISLQTAVFSVGSRVTNVTVFISPALLHVASLLRGAEAVPYTSSGGMTLYTGLNLMCLWEGVSSGSSYVARGPLFPLLTFNPI